jgi:D-alanyl-D-alanine dipeptidase
MYNTSMTNNNTNGVTKTMTTKAHDVRVIKHIGTSYDVYANFPTVQEALDYMRRMNFSIDTWYIIDANDNRLRLNAQNKLEVFHSLIG